MRMLSRAVKLTAIASLLSVAAVAPVHAGNSGTTEGCTPGYWKNHTENWYEKPDLKIPSNLGLEKPWAGFDVSKALEGDTLLDALKYRGGKGAEGAERILLRAAVASWLNAAHEELEFPLRRDGGSDPFVPRVNAAIASGDRAQMLDLAAELDRVNNLGCPL
ncbi:hypothetical protein [Nocardioides sp. SYSU DS0663]|uniref:hypothetical protein n=1 Tax=Nocardioides sp. SYSU DS0663 TaxID=3416445 RepID=UPI003F4B46BE